MLIKLSKVLLLAIAGILLSMPANAQQITTYDFNSLSIGDISGQDNWGTEDQGGNCCNNLFIASPSSYNGTNYADAVNAGGGRNLDIWRINDGGFSIPTFTGNEPASYIQFDATRGYWGHVFGLGYDADGDSKVLRDDANELGIRLQVVTRAAQLRLINAAGTTVSAAYSIRGTDWHRFKVVMDLTANSGQGSASVYALNLTAGETSFTAVSGLQNLNMGLVPAATDARNPQYWNALYMNIESGDADFDNLYVFTGINIPTMTEWAAIILGSLLTIAGSLFIWRRFS